LDLAIEQKSKEKTNKEKTIPGKKESAVRRLEKMRAVSVVARPEGKSRC